MLHDRWPSEAAHQPSKVLFFKNRNLGIGLRAQDCIVWAKARQGSIKEGTKTNMAPGCTPSIEKKPPAPNAAASRPAPNPNTAPMGEECGGSGADT